MDKLLLTFCVTSWLHNNSNFWHFDLFVAVACSLNTSVNRSSNNQNILDLPVNRIGPYNVGPNSRPPRKLCNFSTLELGVYDYYKKTSTPDFPAPAPDHDELIMIKSNCYRALSSHVTIS